MTIETANQTIRTAYGLGDIVYHRTAFEKVPGIITQISAYPGGHYYLVSWGNRTETRHYEMELTNEFVRDFTCE